nr:NAD-dependent deacylase [Desulfolutivibrio sulfodismutans]
MGIIVEQAIARAAALWRSSMTAVAVTGAGISVAAGIPDFRSPGGLWTRYDPMRVATAEAIGRHPEEVWAFLLEARDVVDKARPTPAHHALARLEAAGRLAAVITQNIDNLHQAAGSHNVIEYHGGMGRYHCHRCRAAHDPDKARTLGRGDIPWLCRECGGVVRPDIVFFGEPIPLDALRKSGQLALAADFLLVVGTSGEVAPANTLPFEVQARGGIVVEVNPGESAYQAMADIRIEAPAEVALPLLEKCVLDGAMAPYGR